MTAMTEFQAGLAALSANVYREGRERGNIAPLPPGAVFLSGSEPEDPTGFEARAYEYQGRIVIAYAGTLPGPADILADAALGLGMVDSQLKEPPTTTPGQPTPRATRRSRHSISAGWSTRSMRRARPIPVSRPGR
ncbi:MAG: hypothetical protein WDO56_29300 [Gammaproteobacteria bacterium]